MVIEITIVGKGNVGIYSDGTAVKNGQLFKNIHLFTITKGPFDMNQM